MLLVKRSTCMSQEVSKCLANGLKPTTNGVYWGYNPFTNHLLTSWDIQVLSATKLYLYCKLHTPKFHSHPQTGTRKNIPQFTGSSEQSSTQNWQNSRGDMLVFRRRAAPKKQSHGRRQGVPLAVFFLGIALLWPFDWIPTARFAMQQFPWIFNHG